MPIANLSYSRKAAVQQETGPDSAAHHLGRLALGVKTEEMVKFAAENPKAKMLGKFGFGFASTGLGTKYPAEAYFCYADEMARQHEK